MYSNIVGRCVQFHRAAWQKIRLVLASTCSARSKDTMLVGAVVASAAGTLKHNSSLSAAKVSMHGKKLLVAHRDHCTDLPLAPE